MKMEVIIIACQTGLKIKYANRFGIWLANLPVCPCAFTPMRKSLRCAIKLREDIACHTCLPQVYRAWICIENRMMEAGYVMARIVLEIQSVLTIK